MKLMNEFEETLLKQRRKAEERDAQRRAEKLNYPYLNLISIKVPTEIKAMRLVSEQEAKKALLVPLQLVRKKLIIAAFDPEQQKAKEIIEFLKKDYETQVYVTSLSGLKHSWSYYKFIKKEGKEISGQVEIDEKRFGEIQKKTQSLEDITETIKSFKDPLTSRVLEIILGGALATDSSDIHLEPTPEATFLRLRIDGLLHTVSKDIKPKIYHSLISRIKLLSSLKLNVNDQSQDGRFTIKLKDRNIEIRTSIIPSEYGETIVMRLLDPISLKVNLEELGWRDDDLEIIRKTIEQPNGLILNTGPTGSGKTTTLYAFLQKISKPEIKIITIEDPVEYHLPGISQTQVDPDAGYTFATGLRSILRQDPDVVLIGEIRDKETAEIAMNASLTGHLVLSTLHTNDAVGAIPRLIDLGAKPQIIGPAIRLIIAQRLIRRLCLDCKIATKFDSAAKEKIKNFLDKLPARVIKPNFKEINIYQPKGCKVCAGLGYKGRIAIFELFVVTEIIQEEIYKNPSELTLKELARQQGMVTMEEDGIIKVLKGLTSLEELERITGTLSELKL